MAWDDIFTRPGGQDGRTELVFRGKNKTVIVPLDFDDMILTREELNFRLYNMSGNSPEKAAGVIFGKAPPHLELLPRPASGR